MSNPNPVPVDFVVKNGCQIFSAFSDGIPHPSSLIEIVQFFLSSVNCTSILLLG